MILYNRCIAIDPFSKISIALCHIDCFYMIETDHDMTAFTIREIVTSSREVSKHKTFPFRLN